MKLAISGKGGVGKSTLAAALALLLARRGRPVLAVDADPDANLAGFLGLPAEALARIAPISQQAALIEERTGAKVKHYGQIFKLNPEVADLAERFAVTHQGVSLLVLGAVKRGGGGCACPESVLLRALVTDLTLYQDETLIMDMEAGIEHLGRGTARGVDALLIVFEPGQRSVESAATILRLAGELGLKNIQLVANKVAGPEDEKFVRAAFPGQPLLGVIPFSPELRATDRPGRSVLDGLNPASTAAFEAVLRRLETPEAS
jgi:CO dehydrogenase maturation factor